MESMEDLKREFKDHVATLTEYKEVSILEWREPGTCCYAVKYMMSANTLAVSGDLGEAVFILTWNAANLKSYQGLNAGYFYEKLRAYRGEEYEFSETMAINELKEQIEIIKNYHGKDEIPPNDEKAIELLNNMIETIKGEVISCEGWKYYLTEYRYYNDYSEVDPDCDEWIFDIGKTIPSRIKLYLIGLQMAWKQLNRESEEM